MFIAKTLLVAASTAITFSPLAFAQAAPAPNPAPAPVVPAKPAAPLVPPPSATPPQPPRPALSPVKIRVEQPSKTNNEGDKKTVTRSLKIFLSNSGNEPLELKVKFAFLGRDVDTKDTKVILEGDRPASVKPRSTEIVETNTATAVMTEAKFDAKRKRIPATGMRFIGYSIKVFNGDQLVAESYDPISLKDELGQGPAKPKVPSKSARPDAKKPGALGV